MGDSKHLSMGSLFRSWLAIIHEASILGRRTERIAACVSSLFPPNARILDVGSGNGKLAKLILRSRPDVYIEGVDVMPWPDQAVHISLFNGVSIPALDEEWDYCMISDVLHHCDDPAKLLAETVRVSKLGLVIKDHISSGFIDHSLLSLMDWAGNRGHGVKLTYQYWSKAQWSDAFASAGLIELHRNERLNLYPFPLTVLLDRKLHFVSLLHKNREILDTRDSMSTQNGR